MPTDAQLNANRGNSLRSTGPKSEEGKIRTARNAVTLGLFTMNDFVLPEESDEHNRFCAAFWNDLQPTGPIQETYATEIIRAAWRLRRCGIVEAGLAANAPNGHEQNEANLKIQTAVDRARAQANATFRRSHAELRRLKTEERTPTRSSGHEFVSSTPATATPAKIEITKQTQLIPRGAPCPCGSGEKYKRCCGRNAPPLLHEAA